MQFLQDTHLIGGKNAVIGLSNANLSGDDLSGANLSNADLSCTNLLISAGTSKDVVE